MKIVILDGFTANPGDLSWDGLKELGELVVYDRTPVNEVINRAAGAEVILTNKVIISAEIMDQLPGLKYIGVLATGYNVVDVKAAAEKGIVVTNIPAYSTMSVAQMAMAHLLNITNRVSRHADSVKDGRWENSKDFSYWLSPQIELMDMTMGIVGLGNTGMATAKAAMALGMKILAFTSKKQEDLPEGIVRAEGLDQLLKDSDVVSLHCPLTESTKHIINAESLAKMKKTAILLNTGRGPLVDEQAVADALKNGSLYAFGADVLTQEPPVNGSPLIGAPRCYLTPHIAWATGAARKRLVDIAIGNVKAYAKGAPVNRVG